MGTVQQFERLGGWPRHDCRPALFSGSGKTIAARADRLEDHSNDRRGGAAFAVTRMKERAAASHAAVDGRSVVYVIVDDLATRESLEALVSLAGWRCKLFASVEEFLSEPRILEHSCILLDSNHADMTGLDLQKRLPDRMAEMPIVFVSRCADVRVAVEAMKRGAIDFLTKPCCDDVLVAAIEQAFERSRNISGNASATQAILERRATLSRREDEVMRLVVTGFLNKQIGFELGISEITVKAHRGQVMRKMEARSLAGLVTMAGQIGLTGLAS
jgi:FixJ family two-component response regulator